MPNLPTRFGFCGAAAAARSWRRTLAAGFKSVQLPPHRALRGGLEVVFLCVVTLP